MSLYACFAEREEERSFTSLKKYGLSNTLGFRKPAALFLPFSVSWVSRRWGRGTGNGPARKPCRVMPFPAFVSWYGHCCVSSVWLCFLPSQINSFYTVSARWYSGLCSFPSQITVFTVSARWYSVPIKSFCFLFIWFKLWIFSPLTPSHFTNFCTVESGLDSEVLRDLKIKKKKSLKGTDPKNYVLTLLEFVIELSSCFKEDEDLMCCEWCLYQYLSSHSVPISNLVLKVAVMYLEVVIS